MSWFKTKDDTAKLYLNFNSNGPIIYNNVIPLKKDTIGLVIKKLKNKTKDYEVLVDGKVGVVVLKDDEIFE